MSSGHGREWLLDLAKRNLGDAQAEAACQRELDGQRKRGAGDRLEYQEIDLSQNQVSLRGCRAVVDVSLQCRDLRVLKLFKNEIGDKSSSSLCRLMEGCIDLEQLHLSYNRLTEVGASEVIKAAQAGRSSRREKSRGSSITLWLRLENNRIRNPQQLLEELWEQRVEFCEARDAHRCGPRVCKRHALMHIPYFTKQDVADGNRPLEEGEIVECVDSESEESASDVSVGSGASTASRAKAGTKSPPRSGATGSKADPKGVQAAENRPPVPQVAAGSRPASPRKQHDHPPQAASASEETSAAVSSKTRSEASTADAAAVPSSVKKDRRGEREAGSTDRKGEKEALLVKGATPAVSSKASPQAPPASAAAGGETAKKDGKEVVASGTSGKTVTLSDVKATAGSETNVDRRPAERKNEREVASDKKPVQEVKRPVDGAEEKKASELSSDLKLAPKESAQSISDAKPVAEEKKTTQSGAKSSEKILNRIVAAAKLDSAAIAATPVTLLSDRTAAKEPAASSTPASAAKATVPTGSRSRSGGRADGKRRDDGGKKHKHRDKGEKKHKHSSRKRRRSSSGSESKHRKHRKHGEKDRSSRDAKSAKDAKESKDGKEDKRPAEKSTQEANGTEKKARASPDAAAPAKTSTGSAVAPGLLQAANAGGAPAKVGGGTPVKLDIAGLQKKLAEEREKLRVFVIKAKQEWADRAEKAKASGGGVLGETDEQEYYHCQIGEEFGPGNRFRAEASIGRGVFSSVFRCKDKSVGGQEYAIKFVRSNAMMRKAAEKEIEMYKRLSRSAPKEDAEGAQYIIGLSNLGSSGAGTFEHAGHLCLVFDLGRCDLRHGLQKYGQGRGLPLPTVQQYTKQIFQALRVLRKLKVIHGDLKPDNLLMSMDKTEIRLIDFGSAMDVAEQVHAQGYVQPRYYRAPEIMLGHEYDTQIDMWSAGTTIYELATGKILFTGKTNNAMLKQILDVCGAFQKRFATSGASEKVLGKKHFNANGDFVLKDPHSITGEDEVIPMRRVQEPTRPIPAALAKLISDCPLGFDTKRHDRMARSLGDLIVRVLRPDPAQRMTPELALDANFFEPKK